MHKNDLIVYTSKNAKGGNQVKRTRHMIIILVLLIAAGFLMTIFKSMDRSQAVSAFLLPVRFEGEYSLGGEPWQELTPSSRIPAGDRELRLRGRFNIDYTLDEVVFLYLDHVDVTIKINGEEIVNTIKPTERISEDFCGTYWYECLLPNVSGEDDVEIALYSAHSFGHKNAYRDFLGRIYTAHEYFLKNFIMQMGRMNRLLALAGVILALLILGFSLAFALIGIPIGGRLAIFGLSSLLMSGYIALDAPDVSLWSEIILINTSFSHLCMMLAALGFGMFIVDVFATEKKKMALAALSMLAVFDGCIILLSGARVIRICSMLMPWGIAQGIVCVVLLAHMLQAFSAAEQRKEKDLLLVCIVMQVMILTDLLGSVWGWKYAGNCSKAGFFLMLLIFLVWTMRIVLEKYRQAMRVNQLEGELEESQITMMVSQIHPHFLFNSLSAIRHLCRTQPEVAWEALGDFASYLRANTDALTSTKLIPFSQELRHIQSYLKLEKLRMGERLNVVYDIQEEDFCLPPLTIQPLVENAVKHGIFYAKNGGTVCVATRREGDAIVIRVSDDGIGFNVEEKNDTNDRVYVGIRNVQTRLKKLLHAQMTIESEKNHGTTVTIRID